MESAFYLDPPVLSNPITKVNEIDPCSAESQSKLRRMLSKQSINTANFDIPEFFKEKLSQSFPEQYLNFFPFTKGELQSASVSIWSVDNQLFRFILGKKFNARTMRDVEEHFSASSMELGTIMTQYGRLKYIYEFFKDKDLDPTIAIHYLKSYFNMTEITAWKYYTVYFLSINEWDCSFNQTVKTFSFEFFYKIVKDISRELKWRRKDKESSFEATQYLRKIYRVVIDDSENFHQLKSILTESLKPDDRNAKRSVALFVNRIFSVAYDINHNYLVDLCNKVTPCLVCNYLNFDMNTVMEILSNFIKNPDLELDPVTIEYWEKFLCVVEFPIKQFFINPLN